MSIKFLVLGGGGGYFRFWGGACRFYFYGRADFSEKALRYIHHCKQPMSKGGETPRAGPTPSLQEVANTAFSKASYRRKNNKPPLPQGLKNGIFPSSFDFFLGGGIFGRQTTVKIQEKYGKNTKKNISAPNQIFSGSFDGIFLGMFLPL